MKENIGLFAIAVVCALACVMTSAMDVDQVAKAAAVLMVGAVAALTLAVAVFAASAVFALIRKIVRLAFIHA